MSEKGWIKLHRELFEKPIWLQSTPEQKVILITLLGMANHSEKEWEWKGQKYKAKPGQFITSLASISKKCGGGVSTRNVRTALERFEKYEFLTNEVTNKNRLITIVNWGIYQGESEATDKAPDKHLTSTRQAPDKHLTTNKNERIKEYISISNSDEGRHFQNQEKLNAWRKENPMPTPEKFTSRKDFSSAFQLWAKNKNEFMESLKNQTNNNSESRIKQPFMFWLKENGHRLTGDSKADIQTWKNECGYYRKRED